MAKTCLNKKLPLDTYTDEDVDQSLGTFPSPCAPSAHRPRSSFRYRRRKDCGSKSANRPVARTKGLMCKQKPSPKPKLPSESLSEQNFQLKAQNKLLQEELVKVKRRLDESAFSLVSSLRSQLKFRDGELLKLRKNLKNTVQTELEIEVQVYIDECTRLRHHLDELMKEKEEPDGLSSLEAKQQQQKTLITRLKREKTELAAALKRAQSELRKSTHKRHRTKRTPKKTSEGDSKENGCPTHKARDNSQSSNLLTHISLRMQLHKLPKSLCLQTLFGDLDLSLPADQQHISESLSKRPFCLTRPADLSEVCALLCTAENKTYYDIGAALLASLPDWRVFTAAEDRELDSELTELVSAHYMRIKESCERLDTAKTGSLATGEFFSILTGLGVWLSPLLVPYTALVLYSYSFELERVAFAHFLRVYSTQCSEEEKKKAAVVQKCLGALAERVVAQQLALKDVFRSSRGLIYPSEFERGLESLGVPKLCQSELRSVLEALQCEDEYESPCIAMEELEGLLLYYTEGVL